MLPTPKPIPPAPMKGSTSLSATPVGALALQPEARNTAHQSLGTRIRWREASTPYVVENPAFVGPLTGCGIPLGACFPAPVARRLDLA
jgi:hypothetical protein